jgi:type II secretory pathway pseudopilin PulG
MKSEQKRKITGFTLVELMIAMAVTMVLMGAAVAVFRDASLANQVVTQGSDMSENLRASLNLIQLDLQQAGTGIPQNGINIPFTSCASTPIRRPVLNGSSAFPYPGGPCESSIPPIEPGWKMGPTVLAPDATSGTAGNPTGVTDEITILYKDNTVGLDGVPVNQPATPPTSLGCPAGSLKVTGTTVTVTFDATCVNLTIAAANQITVNPGDLVQFSNTNGSALLWVTNVSGQVLTFESGDPFDLNGRTETAGTIQQLETPNSNGTPCNGAPACFPPTLATRIWMITYYLDNVTSPPYTRLIRQVNMNTPTAVAETMENLQFTYNFIDGVNNPANQSTVPAGDSEADIRSVNIYLGTRSSHPTQKGNQMAYARMNLMSQVSLRSMAYQNTFNTGAAN